MGPPPYMWSVFDRKIVMRRIPVFTFYTFLCFITHKFHRVGRKCSIHCEMSLTAVLLKIRVFWNVMPCRLLKLRIIRLGVTPHKILISKSVNSFISILISSFLLPSTKLILHSVRCKKQHRMHPDNIC